MNRICTTCPRLGRDCTGGNKNAGARVITRPDGYTVEVIKPTGRRTVLPVSCPTPESAERYAERARLAPKCLVPPATR